MGGYIGARSGTISATVANVQDVTATDTTPEITLKNTTETDADGSRSGKITFKGEQSGGEESTLAQIVASHDTAVDDEAGDLIFKTNDGSDGASPTERMRIDSNGSILTATLGTDNVHLGEGAGASIASGGNDNVTIGKNAGTAITTGDSNVAIGHEALAAQTTANNNTVVGNNAASSNVTGTDITAIGYQALEDATSGQYNTALGARAAANLTSGDFNTAIGRDTLSGVVTGDGNVAVGNASLAANTSGEANTAVGRNSLAVNTSGGSNVAVGYGALDANTTAGNNTAVGYSALGSNTTGTSDVAVGYNALLNNTTGSENTAIGWETLKAHTTGAQNTALGRQSGYNLTTGTVNTFLGEASGYYITTGSKNVIIGRYTGNNGGLDLRTDSNNVVLSDGDSNIRLRIDPNGTTWFGPNFSAISGQYGGAAFYNESQNRKTLYLATTGTGTLPLAYFANGNGFIGNITTNGSTTSFNSTSDYRLKENVTDISDGITRVKQLAPKRFNFIVDADTTVDGFLAHEAQAVVPEAVTGTHDGMRDEEYEVTPAVLDDDGNVVTEAVMGTRSVPDYQGIDQAKLVPLLTAALQEAIAKIETLETKVAALEAE